MAIPVVSAAALLLALLVAAGAPLGAAGGSKAVFKLGSCYGFEMEMGVYFFMAKIAHDQGYFDDILPAGYGSSAFSVSVTPVNDGCKGATATMVALPLMLGVGTQVGRIYSTTENIDPVIGIAGCLCSGSSMPMSNLGNNFKVPQISGASTNPDLSNKGLYPFFSRVIPPDSMQGAAFAALVMYFKWTRVLAAYPGEAYAQGVAGGFKNKLSSSGSAVTYIEYQFPFQQLYEPAMAKTFDHKSWELIVQQVSKESPQPRIFFTASNQIDHVLRIFRDAGLVSNQTLWMTSEAVCGLSLINTIGPQQAAYQAAAPNDPWYKYDWNKTPQNMKGLICFTPNSFGPKYESAKWKTFFNSMTRSQIESVGWLSARDGWDDSWLTMQHFGDNVYNPLSFDAMSMFIYAISTLLSKGMAPADIKGETLRDQIRVSSFEGISGTIGLNSNGDRLAPYNIWNMLVDANGVATLPQIGVYDSITDAITWTAKPIFADGTTNPPLDRPAACSPGTEYGDAFTGCVPCRPGKASLSLGSVCVNCTAGYYQSMPGASACVPAPRGTVVPLPGALAPTSCPLGSYASDRALTDCTICASGTFASAAGMSACSLAPLGGYVSTVGAIAFTNCTPGQFSAVAGAQGCTACLGGFFQGAVGMSVCSRCDRGTYAPPASSSCRSCSAGMVTESAASAQATDCQCPLGQYCHGTYPACRCLDCPQGMTCPWGAKEVDTMPYNANGVPLLVQPHFYTNADDPLSVYYCHPSLGDARCAGGPPQTCNDIFEGLTCANCPDGYAPKGDRCEPCTNGNSFVLAIMPIIGILACVVTYYNGNKRVETNTSITLGISVVIGLLVTLAQLFATFSQLTMPWPTDIANFFQGTRFLVVNPNVISAHCLGDSVQKQYSLRFILPYCVVIAVAFCFAGAKMLEKMALVQRPAFWWEAPKAVNTVFQIYQAIFIALTAIAVVPYQCYSHPNGKSSVIQYPTVLCGSPEHGGLVAMSVILFVTFVIPFIGIMVWANVYAMSIRGDIVKSQRHLMMFRFLMYRFRPDVWWWGTPFTVRQLLLAFAPMVQPDDPHAQCIFIITVLVIYIPFMCFFWPWKSDELNLLDSISMVFVAIMVAAGSSFMPASHFHGGHLALMKTVLVVLGVVGGVLICYGIYTVFGQGRVNLTGIFALNEQRLKRKEAIVTLISDLHALAETIRALPSQDLIEGLLLMNSYDLSAVHRAIAVFRASSITIEGGSGSLPRRLLAVPSSCSAAAELKVTRSRSGDIASEVKVQVVDPVTRIFVSV